MRNKYTILAVLVIIFLISLVLLMNNANNSTSENFIISVDAYEFECLEPINMTFTLYNNGTEEIEIDDFSLAYNIELHIYDENNNFIKNLFMTGTPTSEITIEPGESYSKTIDILFYFDQFYYIDTDADVLQDMFLSKPGDYRIIANYIDRDMPEETAEPVFVSNQLEISMV